VVRLAFGQLCLWLGWLLGSCVSPAPVRRDAGSHYGSARRKLIIGTGVEMIIYIGGMGVRGDSNNKGSGL
jgi:hypothetical protein